MLGFSKMGSGFPIVFLHGFCENRHLWNYQMNILQNEFEVIAFDLSGFGESKLDVVSDKLSIDFMADEVFASLEKMGLTEYVMIGHSLGGYVALAFAEKQPEKLKGLGMFHSTAFADSEEKKVNRDKTMSFIKRNGVELFSKSFVQPLFYKGKRELLEQEIIDAQEVVRCTDLQTILLVTESMKKRPDRTNVLKNANYPVLYIIGNEDLAVPLAQSKAQCNIAPKSISYFLDNVSHMGMIEEKEKTTAILKKFMYTCMVQY